MGMGKREEEKEGNEEKLGREKKTGGWNREENCFFCWKKILIFFKKK